MNLLRPVFLLFLLVLGSKLGMVLGLAFIILTYKKWRISELVLALILALRLLYMPADSAIQESVEGRVIALKEKSVLIENQSMRYQIITSEELILDSWIAVEGSRIENKDSSHFYSFDAEAWALENRIVQSYYAKTVTLIKPSHSLRGAFQRWISALSKEEQSVLMKLFLNQRTSSQDFFLLNCGFHYAVILQWLTAFAARFFNPKQTRLLKRGALLFLLVFTDFQMALVRLAFFEFVPDSFDPVSKTALYALAVYLYHPPLLLSVSFIIPAGLRLIQDRPARTLFLALMQSWYFSSFNWLTIFGFRFFRQLGGGLMAAGLFDALFGQELCLKGIGMIDPLFQNNGMIAAGKISLPLLILGLILVYVGGNKKYCRLLTLALFVMLRFSLVSPWAEVSMINVGQGDAFLIRLPFDQANILIDTGPSSSYTHLEGFLKARGIRRIDALILTHGDEDHAGNLKLLTKDFNVVSVVDEAPKEGSLSVGGLKLLFYRPDSVYEAENDRSLVLAFSINGLSFLFTGDISSDVEADLIHAWGAQHFDVLKVAHHGSASSTSEAFLKHFSFDLAIVSSGVNNRYHHPSEEVLKRLESFNIPLINTQQSGDVTLRLSRLFNFITTSAKEFAIMETVIR